MKRGRAATGITPARKLSFSKGEVFDLCYVLGIAERACGLQEGPLLGRHVDEQALGLDTREVVSRRIVQSVRDTLIRNKALNGHTTLGTTMDCPCCGRAGVHHVEGQPPPSIVEPYSKVRS